ncbi:MAG: rhodanese-like domain-containing protein [Campylobacterales bacterium]|nr:rhodanese-like domain-containing protein [Campylobacterales bacterium]
MHKLLQKEAITSKELEELLQLRNAKEIDFWLVDVREQSEYNQGYIHGVNELRPTSMVEHWASEMFEKSQNRPIILTCRTANRSGMLQSIFKRHGYQVINHLGGITAYSGKIVRP